MTAASIPFNPLSLHKKTFSPTIIASSTTIPNTKIKVNRDNMLIETSKIGINQKPPMKEIGIPNDTQKANFGFKKIARIITTRNSPK